MCGRRVTKYGGVAQATKPLGTVKTRSVSNNSEKIEAKASRSWDVVSVPLGIVCNELIVVNEQSQL
jgi:hypothetical protein